MTISLNPLRSTRKSARAAVVSPVRKSSDIVKPLTCADIAPSRHDRIEHDGYLTIDARWIVPALLGAVPVHGPVLEPAAGRGHLSLELRRAGLDVVSFDTRRYADPLVADIEIGDIRALTTLTGFAWVVTNLPYSDLEELATHLINVGIRDCCNIALLVRTEWLAPQKRVRLVHEHPHFAGAVLLKSRPRWVERVKGEKGPRHTFSRAIWTAAPRRGDRWLRFAGRPAETRTPNRPHDKTTTRRRNSCLSQSMDRR
jgi:hypothetical protein